MTVTPREKLNRQFERLRRKVEEGIVEPDTVEELEEYAETIDAAVPTKTAQNSNGKTFALKPNTVELYVRNLRIMAEAGVDPLRADASDINAYLAKRHDGGQGLSNNSLTGYQAAARAFYSVFPDLGVDPNDIDTYTPDPSPRHDEQDLFTEDEIFRMRDACGRSRMPVRNRAFLELLIFTLQRLTALLTLRVGDVDLEDGAIYLNDEYDAEQGGLKGALRRGRRRPMYGATKYVRDWIRAHPTGEPHDWLFVGDPNNPETKVGDHWAEGTVHETLHRLGDWAGVDKSTNPHNFRHYGITVLRRDYDCSWDEINAQAGVIKGSKMPKTTYNHIDDNDLMRNIEEAMGFADGEERNRFAPVVCPTCDEVLKSDWRKCPACDERFAPGDDDGSEELEWLADKAAISTSAFKRAVSRAVERELEQHGHAESS